MFEPKSPTFVNALVLAERGPGHAVPQHTHQPAHGVRLVGLGPDLDSSASARTDSSSRNSLPPNALVASGTDTQSITNNSDFTIPDGRGLLHPGPDPAFFGPLGILFPPVRTPTRDAFANANIRLSTKLTQANGNTVDIIHLDYGLLIFREPSTGLLFTPNPDRRRRAVTRFEEPDGSFGFRLPIRRSRFHARRDWPRRNAGDHLRLHRPASAPASAKPASSPPSGIPSISLSAAVSPFSCGIYSPPPRTSPSRVRW